MHRNRGQVGGAVWLIHAFSAVCWWGMNTPRIVRSCFGVTLMVLMLWMPSPVAADNRNAASWYNRVIEEFGWNHETQSAGESLLTNEQWELVAHYRDNPGTVPSPELRQALNRAGTLMNSVRRGAREAQSDFGLDYSQGFELRLPHLGYLRQAARIMQVDALVRLHDGDATGAVDRLASLYIMAGHCGNDRVLISSLVGQHIFQAADNIGQRALDLGTLDPAQCNTLLHAMQRLEANDPFAMVEGIAMEQVLAGDWMAQALAPEEKRREFFGQNDWLTGDEQADAMITAMSEDEFLDQIDQYDQMMVRVVDAFMQEDPQQGRAQLEQIEQEVQAGEFGVLAGALAPSFLRVFDKWQDGVEQFQQRLEQLKELAQCTTPPETYINAAVEYGKGIELLRRIEPERLDEFDLIACLAESSSEHDESVLNTLEECRDALAFFQQGSQRLRCDFSILQSNRAATLCPAYLAGMKDALNLVIFDACHRLQAGDLAFAVEEINVCLGMIVHVSNDEPLLAALMAHESFQLALRLSRAAAEHPDFIPEHLAQLRHAAERIARKDPFGYLNSLHAVRRDLIQPWKSKYTQNDEEQQRINRVITSLNNLAGEPLLYLLAVRETVEQEDPEPSDQPVMDPHPLTRMRSLIDFPALVAAREQAEMVMPHIQQGEYESIFNKQRRPVIAPFDTQMRWAQRDLREGLLWLRSTEQTESSVSEQESPR